MDLKLSMYLLSRKYGDCSIGINKGTLVTFIKKNAFHLDLGIQITRLFCGGTPMSWKCHGIILVLLKYHTQRRVFNFLAVAQTRHNLKSI